MRVFVIGATGYIGSHVGSFLSTLKHDVIGFARNDAGAEKIRRLGMTPYIGDVTDLPDLVKAAMDADATIFTPQLMLDDEYEIVRALLEGYAGSGKTFVFTSGTGVLSQRTGGAWSEENFAEDDDFIPARSIAKRLETEALVRASVARHVRGMVARPPMVWGNGMYAAVELIVESVRKTGHACYVGSGLNLYSHVHVDDLAVLYSLMIENGSPGALYHCVSGELNNRCTAEFVARRLGCTTKSISIEHAIELWGKFATLIVMSASSRSRSPRARKELGWDPQQLDLVDYILSGDITCMTH